MSREIHVDLVHDRWSLKVVSNPLIRSSSSSIIKTIPSSRRKRPQTVIEINRSLASRDRSVLVIRQNFREKIRASIVRFIDRENPIVAADVIGQMVEKSSSTDETCSICLEKFLPNESLFKLNCQHVFHRFCLLQWIERHPRCPYCRFLVYQPTSNIFSFGS